jgi:hypothetical protein
VKPSTGGQRLAGRAALASGVAAMVVGAALLVPARGAPDVGALPAGTPGALPAGALAAPPRSANTSGAAIVGVTAAPTGSHAVEPAGGPPLRLRIPALGVVADVDPAGVGNAGQLLVPDDPRRVGWWIGSAMPGATNGTVLIAGHVDTAAAGPGALFGLEDLHPGADIVVDDADGHQAYRMVARRSYAKRALPADLFDPQSPYRLVLVTCGGEFSGGSYARNVVVYAEPVR